MSSSLRSCATEDGSSTWGGPNRGPASSSTTRWRRNRRIGCAPCSSSGLVAISPRPMVGRGPRVALDVDLLRGGLSLFALVNAAGWAALAAAWAFRPEWAERLPVQLGTHGRYLKAAPIWARLAASLTGFWTLAAALYLTAGHNTAPFIVIILFTAAAARLSRAIDADGAVF